MKENDNIEKYFQKKLTNDVFSFEEAHWDQLEAQLDQALPTTSAPKMITNTKLFFIILLAAIVAFLLGWFFNEVILENFTTSQQEINKQEITLNNNEKISKSLYQCEDLGLIFPEVDTNTNLLITDNTQQASLLPKTIDNSFDSSTTINETTTIEKLNKQTTQQSTITPNQIVNRKNVDIVASGSNNKSIEPVLTKKNKQDTISNKQYITNNKVQERVDEEGGVSSDDEAKVFTLNPFDMDLKLKLTPIELQLLTDSSLTPLGLAKRMVLAENTSRNIGSAESLRSKWGLSLSLAPDFSNTSTSDLFSSLGNSVGVKLDYQFLPRFRIALGTTLSRKLYIAPNSDYTPPKGFWTGGVKPEEVDANCLIFEVPVSVGYHLVNIKKTAIWVNTSLTSQFMLTEEYDYIYATEDPDLVQRWRGTNENNHMFSALSFSISLQRQLLRNWDGFIEPYFGSPLKGIGFGKVNLLGTGVNIGVRYSFTKKNSVK